MRKISKVLLDECASELYLIRIQLVRVPLPFAHDANLHWKQNVFLLSLDQWHPWLGQVDVILLVEVVENAHNRGFACGFLFHLELVLLGIELRNLLDSPNLGLLNEVSVDLYIYGRA